MMQAPPGPPRYSLGRSRQKSIPPQGSGFQKWRSVLKTILNEFTPSNTLAWQVMGMHEGGDENIDSSRGPTKIERFPTRSPLLKTTALRGNGLLATPSKTLAWQVRAQRRGATGLPAARAATASCTARRTRSSACWPGACTRVLWYY